MSSKKASGANRRDHYRAPITLVVEYADADELIEDYTVNLSVGGTFVHTERDFEPGTKIDLALSFPGLLKPIELVGVVRWASTSEGEASGVGVEFTGQDDAARERLQSLIDAIDSGDPSVISNIVRLLVVEDNPHVARLICDGLGLAARNSFEYELQFEFTKAQNGEQAIEKLQAAEFDALLVDMYMPVLDGRRFIEYVRADPVHSAKPIVAMARGGAHAATEILEAGANYFLPKPVRLRQLIATMTEVLTML